jgi:hypothetical protein
MLIIGSITDWETIGSEEFTLLCAAAEFVREKSSLAQFQVIEQVSMQSPCVVKTVSDYLAAVEQIRKTSEDRKKAARKKSSLVTIQKLAKTEAERKKLFDQLKTEFEPADV